MRPTPNPHESGVGLERLVEAALAGDAREGITHLLQEIAALTESFGCVVWRATENAQPKENIGELTLLAAWFNAPNSQFGVHRAAFDNTVSGRAAQGSKGVIDNDIVANGNVDCEKPFFTTHGLLRIAACRFQFLTGLTGASARLGVLAVFRRKDELEYSTANDLPRLRKIATMLPYLYSGARQKAAYGLLQEISRIVQDARQSAGRGRLPSRTNRKKLLQGVVRSLEGTFHAVETSVFLEDEKEAGRFVCALTSEGPHAENVKPHDYRAADDRGFTSLSLLRREPIRVHDLCNPERELKLWRDKGHDRLHGPMRPDLSEIAIAYLGNPTPPPPLSMMVAPLVSDGELLGFLRCWVAESGPAYYSSDDLALLHLVAEYLSQTLGSWRQEQRAGERRKRDHQAIEDFGHPGQRIGGDKDERDIYLAALGMVRQLLPEALFNTIRLKRTVPNQLGYYGFSIYPPYGTVTEELSKQLGRSSIQLPSPSLAGRVMETRKLRLFRGKQLAKHPTDHGQAAGEMIIAPLLLANGQVEGVLELRTGQGQPFPPHAQAVAGSVSTLLALQMAKEKAEEERLKSEHLKFEAQLQADRAQAQSDKSLREALEDVAHQLKSPLLEAVRRVEEAAPRYAQGAIAEDLEAIASLLRRAELTAKLIGLFAKLAKQEGLTITGQPLRPVELVKLVGEVCASQRPRLSPRRNIRLEYDADSFYRRAPAELSADRELLLQALNNLVDNAVKYAYSNSAIRVFGHVFGEGKFSIAVTNKGIPIQPQEIGLVRQRNWRGEQAKASVGEGNGLGLWIVDNIMRAHGGALQVLPTRHSDGITEVRLTFPASKANSHDEIKLDTAA